MPPAADETACWSFQSAARNAQRARHVAAHRLGANARLSRDVRIVDELAAGQRRHAKELREGGDVPHQRFRGRLLGGLVSDVRAQLLLGRVAQEVRWQEARSRSSAGRLA
jgi:hypothetical protein